MLCDTRPAITGVQRMRLILLTMILSRRGTYEDHIDLQFAAREREEHCSSCSKKKKRRRRRRKRKKQKKKKKKKKRRRRKMKEEEEGRRGRKKKNGIVDGVRKYHKDFVGLSFEEVLPVVLLLLVLLEALLDDNASRERRNRWGSDADGRGALRWRLWPLCWKLWPLCNRLGREGPIGDRSGAIDSAIQFEVGDGPACLKQVR